MAFHRIDPPRADAAPTQRRRLTPGGGAWLPAASAGGPSLRIDAAPPAIARTGSLARALSREALHLVAYPLMCLSRRLEERLLELFQKGYVKGTVTTGVGNEATAMAACRCAGRDVVSLLHRDFAAHLLLGATPHQLLCQYLANAESPTHGREGNVHHGDAAKRRFPMMSHLGRMLSLVVGGVWAARRAGEEVFGLAVIGDGGSSTGEFHEAINLASVRRAPVLFLIENNHYAFSTPTSAQYRCRRLSDRAAGYGDHRPDDRRHRSVGGLHGGQATSGRDARRAGAGHPGVHDPAAARPRGLRQGALRARGAHGTMAPG